MSKFHEIFISSRTRSLCRRYLHQNFTALHIETFSIFDIKKRHQKIFSEFTDKMGQIRIRVHVVWQLREIYSLAFAKNKMKKYEIDIAM